MKAKKNKEVDKVLQASANMVQELLASTTCTREDVELFLQTMLTISKKNGDGQVLVRWVKLSTNALRGKITGAFEAIMLRFVIDNDTAL